MRVRPGNGPVEDEEWDLVAPREAGPPGELTPGMENPPPNRAAPAVVGLTARRSRSHGLPRLAGGIQPRLTSTPTVVSADLMESRRDSDGRAAGHVRTAGASRCPPPRDRATTRSTDGQWLSIYCDDH